MEKNNNEEIKIEPVVQDSKPKKERGRYCRNPNCGWRIIEYPLYKGQEEGVPFSEGKDHKEKARNLFKKETWKKEWNWKNVWIGNPAQFILIISIMIMGWSYWHDTQAINVIYNDPCSFVEKNKLTCEQAKESNQPFGMFSNGSFYIKNISSEGYGQFS